ncbi:MAG: hypothetical protein QNJ85_02925 [Gammaproteobacteria bacterium]|nr:hypothetical protein [Gammaproteobacteria bacterium]
MSRQPLRFLLQAFNYALFMAIVCYFATSPSIRILDDDEAVLTIAFAHAGQLREPCRRLSQEELNQLPANMRRLEDCPRERSPVTIEARLDGEILYRETLQPPGLFEDGGVDIYFSARIPAGDHRLALGLNDSVREQGFNLRLERDVSIAPARVLLVGFDQKTGFVVTGAE